MSEEELKQLKHDVGLLAAILSHHFPGDIIPEAMISIADRNLPPPKRQAVERVGKMNPHMQHK